MEFLSHLTADREKKTGLVWCGAKKLMAERKAQIGMEREKKNNNKKKKRGT